MKCGYWFAAVTLSVVVHLAVAGVFLAAPKPAPPALTGGGNGLEVGLKVGLDEGWPDADTAAAKMPPEEPVADTLAQAQVQRHQQPEPEPIAQALAPPAIDAVAAPLATDNLVAATEKPMPSQPLPDIQQLPDERPGAADPSATENMPVAAPAPKGSSQVYGARHPGAGKARNANQYFGQLMAWMNKHKRYPPALKQRKQQGTVEIQFTIGRDGQLLAASLARSCGIESLDEAALQMIADAAPLPPLPKFMAEDTLTLVIPVEYSLITNAVH
jgi:protein TonB